MNAFLLILVLASANIQFTTASGEIHV